MPQVFPDGIQIGNVTLIEKDGLLKTVQDADETLETVELSGRNCAYSPAQTLDWQDATPDPDDVGEALDILAARTSLLGGGATVISDTQAASASNEVSTTSSTYVPVPGMELITDNDNGPNIYVVMFNCEFEMSSPNKTLSFIVEIDGVEDADSERNIEISSSKSPNNGGTFSWKANVGDGAIIRVKWKRSKATATMRGRTLIIQGSE